MFRTVPLSIIRSFSLYTQQWYISYSLRAGSGRNFPSDPARKLSANLYDIYHCFVYNEKLLVMDRETAPKHEEFYSKNEFEKLVNIVCFITRYFVLKAHKSNCWLFIFFCGPDFYKNILM